MRIAHLDGFAGVPWALAEAQRRLGHEVTVFSLHDTPYRFRYDVRIGGTDGPLGWNAALFSRWRTFSQFDVIHVHGGIWQAQLFYPLFKRRFPWKTLVVHLHGSETRTGKGLHYLGSADLLFRSTQDLAHWVPKSVWIPNPITLPDRPVASANPKVRFGHFVSSAANKGTDRVVDLFSRTFGPVRKETTTTTEKYVGAEAELWVVSRAPHDEVLSVMAVCDAVIDQISTFGIYGVVAIEAMAMGKPVLGTPNPDWYPDCPVVRLVQTDAGEQLRRIAGDDQVRRVLGSRGREYVARVHEAGKVARQVLKAYYDAQQLPAFEPVQATSYWKGRGWRYADEFTTPAARQRYAAQAKELLDVLAGIRFSSVVEIGCGFARIGEEVSRRFGAAWVGVDVSRGQLIEARRRNRILGAALLEGSASSLPLRTGTADLALSVEVLMHIPPDRIVGVLRELLRVSRGPVVHLDWYEDYLVGHQTGWCWVHDYPNLWRSLGAEVRETRLSSTGIQSVFVVSPPVAPVVS